jgi:ribonuclease Z
MHGDHVFGLPGLLLMLQAAAIARKNPKTKRWKPNKIQIYGPVGLANFIATSLGMTYSKLNHVHVEVFELFPRNQPPPPPNARFSYYRYPTITRTIIPQNDDGTWTIATVYEVTDPEQAEECWGASIPGYYIYAAEVGHIHRLQCFGFVVREPITQPRNIDADRALAAGIQAGKKYQHLKFGFPVVSDDGSRLIQPEEVLLEGIPRKQRSFALLGDCCAVPEPMAKLLQNVDVLVHEATFNSSEDARNAQLFGGHSSAYDAGKVADRVGAKVLLLNHISPGVASRQAQGELVKDAQKAIQGSTRVQLGYDLLMLKVPFAGFDW